MFSTVSEKGQLTLPKRIRDQMGIVPGSRLQLQLGPDGTLQIRVQARGSASLFGLLSRPDQAALSLEQLDGAVTASVQSRSKVRR
ncbi:MAG: AbrB/MazE/SpoVT family DNA-binding domain-containing protein [Aquabacterium sp.]|nr:AbrB/MazE/SpoVT family DNA-binding domain-containing protein [Aquabacterium sp.]